MLFENADFYQTLKKPNKYKKSIKMQKTALSKSDLSDDSTNTYLTTSTGTLACRTTL
jgi:hypothetical protein